MFKAVTASRHICVTLILAIGLATSVAARPPDNRAIPDQSALTVDNTTYIDANKILMFVTNHGNFGRDLAGVFGNDYGTYYPFTTISDIENGITMSPLYAGGLWLGGIDAATVDTLVAISKYSSEYVPGPMAGGTYQADRPEFRVYKLYGDSLAGNPNQDYLHWPTDQGAPVDGLGRPQMRGDQMLWTVYNDANLEQHDNNNGETDPLGIEVHQSVWARDIASGPAANSVYLKFKLINKGGKTLNNFFASIWFDPDLGDASDDYVGCDPDDNVFFCYNAGASDTHYHYRPPAVGAKLIEGPIVPSEGDTAHVDGLPVTDHRNLSMHSFNKFVNPYGPDVSRESYRFMTGLTKDGSPLLDQNGIPTRYFGYGDPVTGTGFLDDSPADRRMMANFGPFTFRPDDTQQVVIKIAVGHGDDYLNSITKLREILAYIPDVTDVDDGMPSGLPAEFSVSQNYPNPFNPATRISYSLPSRADVDITIYNIMGQTVSTLCRGFQSAGDHTVVWNGTNDSGNEVASGVYFYRVRAGDNVQSRKMMLLK